MPKKVGDSRTRSCRHIKIFINRDQVAGLSAPLRRDDEVMIVCALSGG